MTICFFTELKQNTSNFLSQSLDTISQSSRRIARPLTIAAAVAVPVIIAAASMTAVNEPEENNVALIQVQPTTSTAISVIGDIALAAFTALQSTLFMAGMIGATAHVNRVDSTHTAIPSCLEEDLWSEYKSNVENKFSELREDTISGRIHTRDEYAEIAEKIEFDSLQTYHKAVEKCPKESEQRIYQVWTEQLAEYHKKVYDVYSQVPRQNEINRKYYNLYLSINNYFNLKEDVQKAEFLKSNPELQAFINSAAEQGVALEPSAMEKFRNKELNREIFGIPEDSANAPVDATNTIIPLCNRQDLWPEYEAQIKKTLNSCSSTREFGRQVTEISLSSGKLDWEVKIAPKERIPQAAADWTERQLQVLVGCDWSNPVAYAAFELTNFIQQKRFWEIDRQARSGEITRDQYAEAGELIEFEGTRLHTAAMKICQKELNWGNDVLAWEKQSQQEWKSIWSWLAKHPHAERYRKIYDMHRERGLREAVNG